MGFREYIIITEAVKALKVGDNVHIKDSKDIFKVTKIDRKGNSLECYSYGGDKSKVKTISLDEVEAVQTSLLDKYLKSDKDDSKAKKKKEEK